jgi:hypothetical protein
MVDVAAAAPLTSTAAPPDGQPSAPGRPADRRAVAATVASAAAAAAVALLRQLFVVVTAQQAAARRIASSGCGRMTGIVRGGVEGDEAKAATAEAAPAVV